MDILYEIMAFAIDKMNICDIMLLFLPYEYG